MISMMTTPSPRAPPTQTPLLGPHRATTSAQITFGTEHLKTYRTEHKSSELSPTPHIGHNMSHKQPISAWWESKVIIIFAILIDKCHCFDHTMPQHQLKSASVALPYGSCEIL
jgi:hypothetical protein